MRSKPSSSVVCGRQPSSLRTRPAPHPKSRTRLPRHDQSLGRTARTVRLSSRPSRSSRSAWPVSGAPCPRLKLCGRVGAVSLTSSSPAISRPCPRTRSSARSPSAPSNRTESLQGERCPPRRIGAAFHILSESDLSGARSEPQAARSDEHAAAKRSRTAPYPEAWTDQP